MTDQREAKKNMTPIDLIHLGEPISFARINICGKSKVDEFRVGDLVKVCWREDSSGTFRENLYKEVGNGDEGYRVFDIRLNKGLIRLGIEGRIRDGYYFAYRFEKYFGNDLK